MPPKVENIATLIAKRDIAIASLDEHYEEFNILYQVEPELIALENVHKEIAIKYWSVKKEQSTIAERLIESRDWKCQNECKQANWWKSQVWLFEMYQKVRCLSKEV